ncbi:MAG: hypothetical protein AVDCRST_MAG89-5354 [uncultured Gemmatimonadetes bacterium]|uniref:Lipid A deacylase LpxR family protein n=1 Tax=uncultured Gemmatimonadota bacterium TaxID=203437 RepID=A0A6J4N848_9BACT|nr:MAG: hypothetical protein AVDCRST_MAG89-5354 [uncultured Gemmatimonadota bacterium]
MRLPLLLRRAPGLAASFACIAAPLEAQVRSFELTSDNDAYNFWIPFDVRPDYEYSNGLRLAAELEGAPGWTGLAKDLAPCARDGGEPDPEAGCVSTTLEFGQRLYMPRNDSYLATRGERPYAGWLYVAATGRVVEGPVRHTYGIELGVTGEPSLGRTVMESYHALTGFRDVVGWRHQLGFEPGVVLRYGAEQRAELRAGEGRIADVVADVGATLGNVHTGAQAGVRARVGYDLRHPWSAHARKGTSVYLSATASGQAVLRNLFLDGNTLGSQPPRVHREILVGSGGWGVGVASGGFGAEFRVLARTREYREEPGGHAVSTIELTWRRQP